eukprot:403338539
MRDFANSNQTTMKLIAVISLSLCLQTLAYRAPVNYGQSQKSFTNTDANNYYQEGKFSDNIELSSTCNLIEISTQEIVMGRQSDIVSQGIIQKNYDQRITDKYDLKYVPYEVDSQVIYLQSPVAVVAPNIRTSDSRLKAKLDYKELSSTNDNLKSLQIKVNYECSKQITGVPTITLVIEFDGCHNYHLSWQKSCGNDEIRLRLMIHQMYQQKIMFNHTLQYQLDPPYVKNLFQTHSLMYPVLKSNGAWGGEISKNSIKHLMIEFNCLGVEGTQDVQVVIPSKHGDYQDISFNFRKQCSHLSIFQVLKKDIKESFMFDIVFVLFILFVLSNIFFCILACNKYLTSQGTYFMNQDYSTQLTSVQLSTKRNFNKFSKFVSHTISKYKGMASGYTSVPQSASFSSDKFFSKFESKKHGSDDLFDIQKNQSKNNTMNQNMGVVRTNLNSNHSSNRKQEQRYDGLLNSAFDEEIQIDLSNAGAQPIINKSNGGMNEEYDDINDQNQTENNSEDFNYGGI